MRGVVIVSAALVFLTGCVNGYTKPGTTYQDFMGDRLVCLHSAMAGKCANGGLYETCMAVKGWEIDPKGFKRPASAGVEGC